MREFVNNSGGVGVGGKLNGHFENERRELHLVASQVTYFVLCHCLVGVNGFCHYVCTYVCVNRHQWKGGACHT